MIIPPKELVRQPGDLGVLRGVIEAVAEEARTRGLPSPSLAGFGFISVASDLSIVAGWQDRLPSRPAAPIQAASP